MKCPVCKFIRLLHVHDFINGSIDFKQAGIQTSRVSDASDDCHFLTADNMGIQTIAFDLMFYSGNIFVRGIWL